MKKMIILAVLAALAGAVQADLIAAWNLWGTSGSSASTLTATTYGSHITVAPEWVRGSGSGTPGTVNSNTWSAVRDVTASDLAGAITGNDYMELTITVESGYKMTITNFTALVSRGSTNNPTIQLLYDSTANGYGSADSLGSAVVSANSRNSPATFSVVDAASLVDLTGTVTLRMYAFGPLAASTLIQYGDGNTSSADAFNISGSVVPEPATVGMLGLGALVTLLVRRMRG